MKRAIELLGAQLASWKIDLPSSQVALLDAYTELLTGYELANVIGTRQRDEIVLKHLVDALSCLVVEDMWQKNSIVDVGTGAGLPGIPLAIARSELHVALLEAIEKKVRFLDHARTTLGLRNLEVLHGRAESAGRDPAHREVFDLATARALAPLPVVVEYCAPLLRPGGAIVAMKAQLQEEELSKGVAASVELGLALREVKEVRYIASLPQKERRLVVFDKVGAISKRFPRRVGLAKKRPLGG